jgi:hypothetical protein
MAGQDRRDGARPRDRATGPMLPIPPDVRDAVERSAAIRRGLAILHRSPPEVVAAMIGVHVRAVEAARERLEEPQERHRLRQLFARSLERREPAAPPPAAPPARRDPLELIAEAERREGGLDFLIRAHPETVAIAFAVHPELVHRARALLAARGAAGES